MDPDAHGCAKPHAISKDAPAVHYWYIYITQVQTLNVSRPGEEPDLVAATEDTRLLFGPSAQKGAQGRALAACSFMGPLDGTCQPVHCCQ